METNILSICIVGRKGGEQLSKCIDSAFKVSQDIICIDTGLDDESKSKASKLGVRVVETAAMSEALGSEWVLFLKENEVPILTSIETLNLALTSDHAKGYLIYTRSNAAKNIIDDYQLIRNLDQYKKIGNQACVTMVEPRLVRKAWAYPYLNLLLDKTSEACPAIPEEILKCLSIELLITEELNIDDEDTLEYEKRCLKGEIYYGPTPQDNIDELGIGFIGFRVVHEGYIATLKKVAQLGLGTDIMFLPMLNYLVEHRKYKEAQDLFELWAKNRKGKESYHLQVAGGQIYAGLLLVDKAINCYKNAVAAFEDPWIYSRISILYLIRGDRERAVKYIKRYLKHTSDSFYEEVLTLISKDNWKTQTLSLCMITRDEEDTIGRALESVEGIVDEIVVVDTGSGDRTRDIARKYDGKVIEAQWHNDFSEARNLAIKEATGDYILFLDADEFIDINEKFNLAFLIKVLPLNQNVAFNVSIETDQEAEDMSVSLVRSVLQQDAVENYRVRLFPRIANVCYEGEAFEDVNRSLRQAGVQIMRTELLKITHNRVNGLQRDKRKISAVTKAFASIDNHDRFMEGGLFFLKMGDLEQAYTWLDKIEKMPPKLIFKIARVYARRNQHEKATALVKKGLDHQPESTDLNFSLAELYYQKGRYNKVCDLLARHLDSIEKHIDGEIATEAAYYYGMALLETGDLSLGTEQIAIASEKDPLNTRYKMAGLYAFAKSEQWEVFLDCAGQTATEGNIVIDFEIKDFCDVALIVVAFRKQFLTDDSIEERIIAEKVLEYVIRTKIVQKDQIEKMTRILDEEKQLSISLEQNLSPISQN